MGKKLLIWCLLRLPDRQLGLLYAWYVRRTVIAYGDAVIRERFGR